MNELVSVIMTTYNHEKYVKEAIDSILNQSYDNIELIVVDDGSSDSTKDILELYNDPRMKIIYKTNGGTSDATNWGLINSSGDWIALMSGDDISHIDRIKLQLEIAKRQRFNIVFAIPDLIDEKGESLPDERFPVFFTKHSNNKDDVLRELFYGLNFFCAPSAFFKREVIEQCGMFKRSLLQLQDFDYWIRVAKLYDIKIIKSRLIRYRIHRDNLSSEKYASRIYFELKEVYLNFFNNISREEFYKVFSNYISKRTIDDSNLFDVDIAFILLNNPIHAAHEAGLEKLSQLIDDDNIYDSLLSKYNFNIKNYFNDTLNINRSLI